jgi:hypothetical protein
MPYTTKYAVWKAGKLQQMRYYIEDVRFTPIKENEKFPTLSERRGLDWHRDYDKLAAITEEQVPQAIAEYYTFVSQEMHKLANGVE